MHISTSHIVDVHMMTTAPVIPTSGPLARKIRQATSELNNLLADTRDTPFVRLKISDAREALQALVAQIPPAPVATAEVVVTSTSHVAQSSQLQQPKVVAKALAHAIAPAPPRPRPRDDSPTQKMRAALVLTVIKE